MVRISETLFQLKKFAGFDFMINLFVKRKKLPLIFNFGGSWTLSVKSLAELIANRHEKRYGIKPDIILKKNGQEKIIYFYYSALI